MLGLELRPARWSRASKDRRSGAAPDSFGKKLLISSALLLKSRVVIRTDSSETEKLAVRDCLFVMGGMMCGGHSYVCQSPCSIPTFVSRWR